MRSEFQGISASVAFDTIMDGEYRKLWDENVIEDFEICRLNDFDDIGYYSSKYIIVVHVVNALYVSCITTTLQCKNLSKLLPTPLPNV